MTAITAFTNTEFGEVRTMMRERCPENGIGRRIYTLRQRRGMTQTELADAMHPDTDRHFVAETISAWEHGRKMPTARSIKRLAAVFGVDPDYIINGG